MPPKKNKGQKMDLSSFLADSTTGSWADEMEDMPVAPTVKDPNALKRGDPGYFESLPNRSDRAGGFAGGFDSSRPPREELPLPTRPPYTAFVGNLSFETTEDDISEFFEGLSTVSAKIIRDHEQKPKGFGYVEFTTLDGLKDGLTRTGGQLGGRTVRISVAEPPKETGRRGDGPGGFGPSAAEEASQWRRAGPLPARSPPASSSRRLPSGSGPSSRFNDGPGAGGDVDRDWGAARGSKFAPSAPPSGFERTSSGLGLERGGSGGGGFRGDRELAGGPALADTPNDWRKDRLARPPPPPAMERGPSGPGANRGPSGFIEREVGLAGPAAEEEVWSRGSKFQPKPEPVARPPPHREVSGSGLPTELEEKGDWRSNRKASTGPSTRQGSVDGSPGPSSAQASPVPARKALNLLPRTSSAATSSTSTPTSPNSESATVTSPNLSKASPFGTAKFVDTAAKEREATDKLAKRDEERKAEAEVRAKALAEEREKAAEEAKKAAAAAQAARASQQERPGPGARHPSRGGNGPQQRQNGPPQQQQHPSRQQPPPSQKRPQNVHPSRLAAAQQQQQQNAAPAQPDEDGFIAPASSNTATKRSQQLAEQAAKEKQERDRANDIKPSFSFAAAAKASGLVEDVGEGEDDEEEEEEKSTAVEEVTKAVEEVKV